MMSEKSDTMVVVGTVGAPHGVKGAVHVKTALEHPKDLKEYSPLFLPDGRSLRVVEVKAPKGEQVVAQFAEINTRDEAKSLTLKTLSIPRARLPQLEDENFYHADLIGMQAVTQSGEALGDVKGVHNFGAGDVLEIASPDGVLMIAFTKLFVPGVDMAARTLTVSDEALVQDNDESGSEDA